MIFFQLLKPRFISLLITIFISLYLSTAIAGKENPGKKTNTDPTVNYTATIRGVDSASITEDDDPDFDNLLEVKGKLRVSDRDSGESSFSAETISGSYGNLVITTKGHWYYATENDQSVIQNLNNGDKLSDFLTISSVDGTTHKIVITISGIDEPSTANTNQIADISGIDKGSITEDSDPDGDDLLETEGKLSIVDNDAGESAFIATTHNGNYGNLTIDTVGNWNYAASNNQSIIQNLTVSDTLEENLIVSSIDGTTHTVVMTIYGVDEISIPSTAIIGGVDTGSVTEDVDPDNDTEIETEGQLTISDNDANEAAFIASAANTSFSDFTVDSTGFWRYDAYNNLDIIQNLNANETITDTYTVTSVDGTTHDVVITIHGADDNQAETNQAAVISGIDRGSVTEDVDPDNDTEIETEGQLTISDNNANEAAFIASAANTSFSDFTVDSTGFWRYDAYNNLDIIQNLNANETITDTYTVTSVDGTTHDVVITIHGADDNQAETNQAAVISGTDRGSVTEDVDPNNDNLLEVAGKLNITDADVDEAAFIAKTTNTTYASFTINADGSWNYVADNDLISIQNLTSSDSLTDSLSVYSVDGTSHTVVITINGSDETSTTTTDITLSWTAPAERENNEPISLSEIEGYKIYYGTTQDNYSSNIVINDNTAEGYTFTNLPAGTYYFVITTKDTDGRESPFTSEIFISI